MFQRIKKEAMSNLDITSSMTIILFPYFFAAFTLSGLHAGDSLFARSSAVTT